jgi:hypothetical protein
MKIKAKDSSNESSDVRRARAKLKKHFSSDDKKITAKALQKAAKSIEQWISRHESDRVSLAEKDVKIFDANKHPAEVSKHIKNVMLQISQAGKSNPPTTPLHGRVTG